MKFPIEQSLDCPPFGKHSVAFNRQEDDPKYNLPGMPEKLAASAHEDVVSHWPAVWDAARPKIEQLLTEYEYGKTLQELLSDPKNSLNVFIMVPEGKERYRLDVFIDIGLKMGSHVFGVEFEELVAKQATATF